MEEENIDYETSPDKDLILKKTSLEEKDTNDSDGSDYEYFFPERSLHRRNGNIVEDKKGNIIEQTVSREETLHEYLLWQLRLVKIPQEDFNIGEILISYINSKGYLPVPLSFISDELNIPLEKLEKLLVIIQSFEPPGVGARDIKECLLLQLKIRGSYPLAEKIINEYLNEIKLNTNNFYLSKMFGLINSTPSTWVLSVGNSTGFVIKANPSF